MKPKRPAVVAAISLLTLGGLYYGLFRPGPESIEHPMVAPEPKRAPAPVHPTNISSGNPTLSNEPVPGIQGPGKSKTADAAGRAGTEATRGQQAEPTATSVTRSLTADRKTSRPAKTPAGPIAETGDESYRTPMGIRLAPDVRLPVAAMPNDLKLNPIKQKALQDIIDEYYQTVAAVASAPASGAQAAVTAAGKNTGGSPAAANAPQPDGTLVVEENGEKTRIVANSPAVDAARKRADLRFKALFGHAAYNRMTMNTLLESRLPQIKTEQ